MIPETDAYTAFVEKFKAKKTTDDCYTPESVYNAVAEWVANEYGLDRQRFVRPFYPGGDYQRFDYKDGCAVVDNPPFSILAQIIRFYGHMKIPFFLFAPALTTFSAIRGKRATAICTNVSITYENGAVVSTSFVTNMDNCLARSAPGLYEAVRAADEANRKEKTKELPKYEYDPHVVLAHKIAQFSRYGIDFAVPRTDGIVISEIEQQKATGKQIFGGGVCWCPIRLPKSGRKPSGRKPSGGDCRKRSLQSSGRSRSATRRKSRFSEKICGVLLDKAEKAG